VIKIDLFSSDALAKVLHYYNYPSDGEKIICPFHEDVMPSMQVNYDIGTCFCYGCQKSYDALSFVKQFEKQNDDLKACIKLAHIMRTKKVSKIKAKAATVKRADNKQLLTEAKDYYFNLKTINWNDEHSEELDYMLKRGFKRKTLNMCKAKYTYNKSYPLVFPMFDNDEFKGWVCRTTLKTIEKKRKYLYNEGFSRATTLCGTYTKGKVVVICEGYMDMLKFKQFGLKNVIAILGWKITAEQISKLKKMGITHVISALDNDECGRKGTAYLKNFFKVTEFQYPVGVKDAGDMSQEQFNIAFNKTKAKLKGGK
jgi:DNA primase